MPSEPDKQGVLDFDSFTKIRDVICEKLGLYFEDNKLTFMEKRVLQRMHAKGIETAANYCFLLKFGDREGQEIQALANLVTTNETYMFREFEQLQSFSDACLPEVIKKNLEKGIAHLKIWCAGCSSGEEAYTLAIIMREVIEESDGITYEITATDIDEMMLERARRAIYEKRSVKGVPHEYMQRHFKMIGKEQYLVLPETKNRVEFMHLNLHDRYAMRRMRGYDFIFCRNVLIYFNETTRKQVLDHFYNSMNANGFIYLGHSESVGRITNAYTLRRMGGFLVYMKA